MNKFMLSLCLVLLAVIGTAYAADFTIGTITPVSGNPGQTVSVSVTVTNNNLTESKTYSFVSTALTFGANSITAPTIPSITVNPSTSGTTTFSITIPARLAGTYQGNITVTDATVPTNTLSTGQVNILTINSFNGMNIEQTSFEIKSSDDKTKTGTFTIKNTGSNILTFGTSAVTYNAANFTDSRGKIITLSFTDLSTVTINPDATTTVTTTSTIPSGMKEDTYTGILTLTTGSLTDTITLSVAVTPELCEEGEKGTDLEIVSIEEPDDGDSFKPGETIDIKVKVENNADEEMDVEVEAFLYSIKNNDEIARVTSDAVEIDDGDAETIEFSLEIPIDEDVEDGNYVLYIKAYEEGQEDDNCIEDSIDVEIEREKDDATITKVVVTPTTVNPGETVEFTVTVNNIGNNDQDEITVKITGTELGLNLVSNPFDLDEATDDDNEQVVIFTYKVPSNIKAGTYDIEVGVYDEDDDLYDDENAEELLTLTVGGSAKPITKDVTISVENIQGTIGAGKTYSIPVKITNNKAVSDTFTAKFTNIDDWATSTSEKTIILDASKSETVYLSLKANEEVGEGKYSATVEVTDSLGNVVGTQTVTIGTEEKEGFDFTSYFSGSKLFWIIGDIILVIVAIFFIKLIFSRKKGKPVKEVRL